MNIFKESDYKAVLKNALSERAKTGRRVNLAKLSQACGIQSTYLSRVLNHESHLNSDQLYLACLFLGFKENEIKYTFLLHEAQRSAVRERKAALLKKAQKLQNKALQTESYISAQAVSAIDEKSTLNYHLNPITQLVHIFLCIPKYSQQPKLIAEDLKIEKSQLEKSLNDLVIAQFITWQNNKWKVLRESIHLSKTSDHYRPHRTLLRFKALDRLLTSDNENDYCFSVLFTADPATQKIVQEKFLEFLKGAESLIKKAPAEYVYQLNFDLFNWCRR